MVNGNVYLEEKRKHSLDKKRKAMAWLKVSTHVHPCRL